MSVKSKTAAYLNLTGDPNADIVATEPCETHLTRRALRRPRESDSKAISNLFLYSAPGRAGAAGFHPLCASLHQR